MNKLKPGVRYIDDILKEVAEEQGRDYKEVKEAWRLHVEHVKKTIDSGETDVIELPRLGNLFFNTFTYNAFSKRSGAKPFPSQERQRDKIKDLITKDKEIDRKTSYLYPQVRRASVYSLFRVIKRSIDKRRISYSTLPKIIKRIEEYSTKIFKNE
jgi:hypothetical protein